MFEAIAITFLSSSAVGVTILILRIIWEEISKIYSEQKKLCDWLKNPVINNVKKGTKEWDDLSNSLVLKKILQPSETTATRKLKFIKYFRIFFFNFLVAVVFCCLYFVNYILLKFPLSPTTPS